MSEEFFEYIENGDLKNVKKCIEENGIVPSSNDNWAICLASFYGDIEVVKYLMTLDKKYNVDPSAVNNNAIFGFLEMDILPFRFAVPAYHRARLFPP